MDGKFASKLAPEDAPPYEVVATAADGSEILRETFRPKLVLRPYLDRSFRDLRDGQRHDGLAFGQRRW